MVEPKTKLNNLNVKTFIAALEDVQKRADCKDLIKLFRAVTGKPARMWGDSIVGFDSYHFKYESGREGDSPLSGFSPRKQNISIYIMNGFSTYDAHLQKLGKFKTAKTCLYIKKLSDVDKAVLQSLIEHSVSDMRKKYAE